MDGTPGCVARKFIRRFVFGVKAREYFVADLKDERPTAARHRRGQVASGHKATVREAGDGRERGQASDKAAVREARDAIGKASRNLHVVKRVHEAFAVVAHGGRLLNEFAVRQPGQDGIRT